MKNSKLIKIRKLRLPFICTCCGKKVFAGPKGAQIKTVGIKPWTEPTLACTVCIKKAVVHLRLENYVTKKHKNKISGNETTKESNNNEK